LLTLNFDFHHKTKVSQTSQSLSHKKPFFKLETIRYRS